MMPFQILGWLVSLKSGFSPLIAGEFLLLGTLIGFLIAVAVGMKRIVENVKVKRRYMLSFWLYSMSSWILCLILIQISPIWCGRYFLNCESTDTGHLYVVGIFLFIIPLGMALSNIKNSKPSG